jgi:hypothetical protein
MSKILNGLVGLVIIGGAISFAATPAHAESKAAQCQRFKQANVIFAKQLASIKRDANQGYSANTDRYLSVSEAGLRQFQMQQFSDPKIRGFQQGALNLYVQAHNNTISLFEARERHDRPAFNSAYKQMLADLQPIGPLDKQAVAYCGRSK